MSSNAPSNYDLLSDPFALQPQMDDAWHVGYVWERNDQEAGVLIYCPEGSGEGAEPVAPMLTEGEAIRLTFALLRLFPHLFAECRQMMGEAGESEIATVAYAAEAAERYLQMRAQCQGKQGGSQA